MPGSEMGGKGLSYIRTEFGASRSMRVGVRSAKQ